MRDCASLMSERACWCAVRRGAARAGRLRHQRHVGSDVLSKTVIAAFRKQLGSRFPDLSAKPLPDFVNIRWEMIFRFHDHDDS